MKIKTIVAVSLVIFFLILAYIIIFGAIQQRDLTNSGYNTNSQKDNQSKLVLVYDTASVNKNMTTNSNTNVNANQNTQTTTATRSKPRPVPVSAAS